ncbi:MAG: hypothetical protein ACRDJW_06645 [Thermomicrobiales bacterium]
MINLNPTVLIEIGQAEHQERVARGEAIARLHGYVPPRRPLRVVLAAALVGVAHRLSPALDQYTPTKPVRA